MSDIEWLRVATIIISALIGVGWVIFWFWVRNISADVKNAATKAELISAKEDHAELLILVSDIKEKQHDLRSELPTMHPTRFEFLQEQTRNDRNMAEIKAVIKEEGSRTVSIITQRLEDLGVTKKN